MIIKSHIKTQQSTTSTCMIIYFCTYTLVRDIHSKKAKTSTVYRRDILDNSVHNVVVQRSSLSHINETWVVQLNEVERKQLFGGNMTARYLRSQDKRSESNHPLWLVQRVSPCQPRWVTSWRSNSGINQYTSDSFSFVCCCFFFLSFFLSFIFPGHGHKLVLQQTENAGWLNLVHCGRFSCF